ncbi:MAG: M23 family metallopeptidase [Paracoccaceae bacterium]|jgi:murein DD-endopeptidase MepM/ murein hydrolase activator NlpD|nr:M23 family metallopeptidase [Paracoccaceae bacterium]MDP7186972.1 M23 family metallopeptidase [Paracoccaceae bacterium]
MRLRWFAALLAGGVLAGAAFWLTSDRVLPPGPDYSDAAVALRVPLVGDAGPVVLASSDSPPELPSPVLLHAPPVPDTTLVTPRPPLRAPWTAVLGPGDTLDGVLRRAGLPAEERQVFSRAMQTQYDLANLRPGDEVAVQSHPDGRPYQVVLSVRSGERVLVRLEEEPVVRTVAPDLETFERTATVTVDGSIFASLDRAGAPASLAVDLAAVLGGTVDFRRDLRGGETLRLLWREARLPDGSRVGAPRLSYAELALGDALFEFVRDLDAGGSATVFRNGERLRTFAPPVVGARLTSVFGRRRHPVYGDIRMHKGVDFAAPRGTAVFATAPGRVSFVGRRNGYGRVVEIAHGPSMTTMYTHLSAFSEGLDIGDFVEAGDRVGAVGSSGLATGPNLHYEVRLEGQPVDPMGDERLAGLVDDRTATEALRRLTEARRRFSGDAEADTGARFTLSTKGGPT